jgi:hypothetical protein
MCKQTILHVRTKTERGVRYQEKSQGYEGRLGQLWVTRKERRGMGGGYMLITWTSQGRTDGRGLVWEKGVRMLVWWDIRRRWRSVGWKGIT